MAVADEKLSRRDTRARRHRALASAIGVVIEHLEERRMLSLTNGGFESPDVGSGNYQASPSDAGWSFYDAGIASNGASELGSVAVPGGSQAAVLGAMGSLSQTFNPGGAGIYYLQLHAAVSAYGPSFQVSIDGNQVGSTFYGSSEAGALITTPLFALTDGAHTLEINGGSGLVIDDVALAPVPFAPPSLGVNADYHSTGIVNVGWSDPGWPDVTGSYSVERSLDGVQFTTVPSGSVTQNVDHSWSLEDPTLPGTGYFYRVVASYTIPGDTNFQLTSGVSSITTPSSGVPSPVATAMWAHAVDVQIPENDPAAPFDLLRSTDGVNYALLGTVNTSVFHDTNVLPETTYYYRLQSHTYPQEGQMSDAASVTTPRELLIHLGSGQTRVTQGGRSFVLDLNAAGNPVGSDLVGWDIDWGDGGAVQHVAGSPQSVPHSYTGPGNYQVSAVLDWQSYHYPVYGLSFDTSFGGGMVRGSFGTLVGDSANAVATLPTGRVLVAGNSDGSFALSQFLADGTPDPLFGVDGLTTTSFGSNYTARGAAVAVADGKYVVAGDVYSTASGYDFALARYNADGTLDQSFGNGGTVITNFASDARANAVAVQANGDIVVAGFTGGNFAIAHYHADGSPDTSWGSGTSKLILNFGSASEIAYGIGIAPDGKIVVTGRNDQHTLTIRLLSNGTLDPAFGTNGQKTIDLVGAGDYTYAVAFDAGGRVILAGETNAQFTLIRLKTDGSLDDTFDGDNNGNGIVSIASLGTAYARTVMVEPNGDIVAGGGGEGYYDIVRLRPDGTRNLEFANGGVDRTFDGAPDGGYFSALGAYELDGRLLAMGGVGTSFLMARYLSDNSVTVLSSDALADGSFETPVVSGNWVTHFAGEPIGMWTVQSGSVDQAASTLWQAADGLQSLDMSGNTAGVIYQDVQTVPGQLYTLRFALAGNTAGGSATKGLNVTWDVSGAASPAVVASTTFSTSGASSADMRWAYHEYTLAATASVMRLRFVSLENSAYGPALDDVTLVPANAVVNGSFENATGGAPADWTVDSDVLVQDGNAADGGRYAKLGDDTSVGSFHQNVGTYAGQDYRLSFSLGTLDGASVGTQVWWNGELLDTPVPTGNPGSGTLDWVDFAYTVSAASALTALKFESASDGLGGAAYLDKVQLVPLVKPPAPTNLRAYAASGTRVDLHWQDNSTSETGFVIKSSTDGSNFTAVGHAGAGATNYSVVGLDPNTAYSFLVTAANDGSETDAMGGSANDDGIESEPSNVAQSTTLVDTIDASNLVTVGTWHFNENGTAASGETALPTLLDGIGYRLVAKSVNYCNASYCSWSGCCGSGGMYGDPEYAPAIIEPGVNYCDTGCGASAAVYGDAEYAWTYDYGLDQDRMPVTDADTELRGTDVGLKINGGIRGSIPSWGDYNEAHAYTRDVIGNGQTLAGYYADYDTSDDTGAIELTVQKIISNDTPLPSPSTSGASSVTEGQSYTLTLNAGLATGVDSWSVDWGDGNVESVAGVPQNAIQTVTHVYGDGPGNPSIVATATNAGGSVDAAPREVEILPLAPSDLNAVSTSESQIDLAWTDYSQVASAYSIERSTDGISWAEVATVDGDQTTFQDQTLDEGSQYSYRVRATTGSLYSAYTDAAPATTRPSAATNLTAVATSSTEIDLGWDDNSNTNTGYVIKRSTDGVNYCCTTELTVDASAEAVTGLLPNTTYYFQVISTGAGGDAISIATAQETTLPAGPLPADITNLVAIVSSGPQVDLTWDAADSATDNLRLERRDETSDTWQSIITLGATDTTYSDPGVASNHTYTYRLVATNSYGESNPSEEVTATTGLVAPSGLTAEAESNGQVILTWTDNSENESGFDIWRIETIDGLPVKTLEGEAPASDGTGTVAFTVGDLDVGTSYSFTVAAATGDGTSAEVATSSSVTPLIRSISVSGADTTTFEESYELTLHRSGIDTSLTWQVNWGDGSEVQEVTGTPDASGNLYVSHTYQGPVEGDSFDYAIRANASDSTDTYVADDFTVTGEPSSGLTALPSPLIKAGRVVRRRIVQAFEDVYNGVRYQQYAGFMKGPEATDSTREGNDWDQAALAKQKIDAILAPYGVTNAVTYVTGWVTASISTLETWLGVKDPQSVASLLTSTLERQAAVTSSTTSYTFQHAWLKVNVPDYSWNNINVDPSWKFRDLRLGISDVGLAAGTLFDESAFATQSAESSPLEFYESQISNWIKQHTSAGKPDLVGRASLADVPYDGPIIAKHFTDLPSNAGAGYSLATSVTDQRPVPPPPTAFELESTSAHRIEVTLDSNEMVTGTRATVSVSTAAVGNRPVTIRYSTDPDSGDLIATLYVGDQPYVGHQPTSNGVLGKFHQNNGQFGTASISVTLTVLPPGVTDADVSIDHPEQWPLGYNHYTRARTLGDPIALMIDASQFSDRDILFQQKALNDLASAATTSLGEYQARLIGLVASKYANEFDSQIAAVESLAGAVSWATVGTGFITGVGTAPRNRRSELELINPFIFYDSARYQGIATDLPGLSFGTVPFDSGDTAHLVTRERNIVDAQAMISSYLESSVLEECSSIESVSTAKGFQWAKSRSAQILHFKAGSTSSIEGVPLNQLFVNDTSSYIPGFRTEIQGALATGYDVTVPNILVDINSWKGAVWMQQQVIPAGQPLTGYILGGGMLISVDGTHAYGADPTTDNPSPTVAPAPAPSQFYGLTRPFNDSTNQASRDTFGDPVNMFTGGLYDDETDVSLPNVAFPATFGRHYDSLNDVDTGFGVGWSSSYSDRLTENTDGSIVWTTSSGQSYVFGKVGNASYTNPGGLFGTFAPNKTGFSYREVDGTIYMFSSKKKGGNGRLLSVVDRLGNTLKMDYFDPQSASPILKSVIFTPKSASSEAKARTLFTLSMPTRKNSTGSRTLTDYAGRVWTYLFSYDSSNRRYLASVVSPNSSKKSHQVTQLTTSYTYLDLHDSKPQLLHTITRTVGGKTRGTQTYEYYADRRAFSTTDATGHTEYFSYDLFTSNELKPGQQVHTRYAYHTDTGGHTTKVEFNDAGLITRTINPDRSRTEQNWASYTKLANNDPKTGKYVLNYTTNEVGLTDFYKYDFNKGNVSYHLSNSWDFSPAAHGSGHGIETALSYDPVSNGIAVKTVGGFVPGTTKRQDQRKSTNLYDSVGNLRHTINAAGDVVDMTYDANGLLKTTLAGNAHGGDATTQELYTTTFGYDTNGSGQVSVVTRMLPVGDDYNAVDVQTIQYDSLGNPHIISKATEHGVQDDYVVQNDYDLLNRKIDTIVDPGSGKLNLTTRYTYYDDLLQTMTDPTGRQTSYGYDAMGRQTTVTYLPTGAVTTTQYDEAGNATATIDPIGNATHVYYDERNRAIETVYADGGFSRLWHDGVGRTVASFEPSNSVSSYGLDATSATINSFDREGFLSSVTDAANQKTTFDYNSLGEQIASHFFTRATDSTPYRTSQLYRDALGRVVQTRSDDGTVTTTTYDHDGNVTASGSYDVTGRSFMDPGKFKPKNLPASLKHITTTSYDNLDRAIAVTDPLGYITRTEYDQANRVTAVIDPRGAVAVGVIDPSPDDYKTQYTYDGAGRLYKTILPYVAEDPGHTNAITNTYYGDGRLHTVTNANGKITTYTYTDDTSGSNTRVFDPANHYTLQHQNLGGQVVSVQDRNGKLTSFTYDSRGRQASVTLPAGEDGIQPVTVYTYNAAGNLLKTVDQATELETDQTYDALHRVISNSQTDLNISKVLSTSATTYVNNNVDTVTDGRQYKTSFDYDKAGRPIAAYAAQSRFTAPNKASDALWRKSYDSFGNVLTETDYPDHGKTNTARVTLHTYDRDNRLKTTTEPDPDGNNHLGYAALTTTYAYDPAGNLTSTSQPDGAATSTTVSTYDARNRLKTMTTPDPDGTGAKTGGATSYNYDADGDVLQVTDPAGNLTTYHYDDLDRVDTETTHVYLNGGQVNGQNQDNVQVSRTYGYDNNGNLTDETDRLGRRRKFVFDDNNRLKEERWLIGSSGDAAAKVLHFRYDTGGRQIWADSKYDGTSDALHDYQLTYDALSRVTHTQESLGTTNASAVTLDQTYDAESNALTQTAKIAGSADFTNTYGYDHLDNLTTIYQAVTGVRVKNVVFSVNQIGQTTAIDRRSNGTQVPGTSRTYGYDRAGALTSITYAGGSAEYTIGRDAKHRVATLKQDGGATQNYTYFIDDQLKTAPGQTLDYDPNFNRTSNGGSVGKDNRLKQDANYTYEYDKEGNLILRRENALTQGGHNYVEFTYDFRNRLIGADVYGLGGATLLKSLSYEYDAADRLTRRVGGDGSAADPSDQRFAYDGSDVIFTFNGSNVSPSGLLSRFLLGPQEHQVLAEDTPYSLTAAGTPTRWYLSDYEGSTRKVVDDHGATISTLTYDAFGNVTSHTGTLLPTHQYTGQVFDSDTGLSYYGARWYDPKMGRFLNQDSALEGTNLYAYVGNDPMNYTDPSGLSASLVGLSQSNQIAGSIAPDAGISIIRDYTLDTQALSHRPRGLNELVNAVAATSLNSGNITIDAWGQPEIIQPAMDYRTFFAATSPEAYAEVEALDSEAFRNPYPLPAPLRFLGAAAETVGGLFEAGFGVATAYTGLGFIPAAHGIDVATTGIQHLFGDSSAQTYTSRGVAAVARSAGASSGFARTLGNWADVAISFGGTAAVSKLRAAAVSGVTEAEAAELARGTTRPPIATESEGTSRRIPLTVLNNCFVAGTPVLMADGSTKPIEDVEEGDMVVAEDPDDGLPAAPHEVTAWHLNWTEHLVDVAVDADGDSTADGSIEATRSHPFWTENRGWIDAADLRPGDLLLDAADHVSHVTGTTSIDAVEPVFNLSVEGVHTFFVMAGSEPVLVHNTNPGPRTFITYQAPDPDGKWYTGRASMPGTLQPDQWKEALRYRYDGKNLRNLDFNQARRVFFGTGVETVGGPKSAANMASRGWERIAHDALDPAVRAEQNIPLNGNENEDLYMAEARRLGLAAC